MLHAPRRPGNPVIAPKSRARYLVEFFRNNQWEALDVVLSPTAEEAAIHPAFWIAPADGGVLGLPIRVSLHGVTLLEGVAAVHHVVGEMRCTSGVLRLADGRMLCSWGYSTVESYRDDHDAWENAADDERHGTNSPAREKIRAARSWDARFAPKRVAAVAV